MDTLLHSRFSVCTFDTLDPEYVEGHDDLHTATQWTMHIRVPRGESVQDFATRVMRTGCEMFTGDYVGGDSFHQWCEPSTGEDDRALHVYFTAPTVTQARLAVREISRRLDHHTHLVGITTAKDWAEWINPWSNA